VAKKVGGGYGQWVTAQDGDTLLQHSGGCRVHELPGAADHNANKDLRTRQVAPGDSVYIPDRSEKKDSTPTEKEALFVRPGVPIAMIRFVHGSPDRDAPDDDSLDHLEISNYRTDRVGRTRPTLFRGESLAIPRGGGR